MVELEIGLSMVIEVDTVIVCDCMKLYILSFGIWVNQTKIPNGFKLQTSRY